MNRLREIFEHQDTCSEEDLHLLKFGRHFRLNSENKLIVGRDEKDNEQILKYHNPATDIVIDVKDYSSPIGLVPHGAPDNVLLLAASICTGYSKAPKLSPVDVVVKTAKKKKVIQVIAFQPGDALLLAARLIRRHPKQRTRLGHRGCDRQAEDRKQISGRVQFAWPVGF